MSHLRPLFCGPHHRRLSYRRLRLPLDRSIQSTGDVIADLTEDLAAEQKARLTYDNILRLSDDPDVNNVIRFLREREIVHFQRFGECLRMCKEKMNAKNIYLTNPAFDKIQPRDQGRG